MRRSRRCKSGASGVVRSAGSGSLPMRQPMVPITPVSFSAARQMLSTRYVVVVFPFVPVTPTIESFREG